MSDKLLVVAPNERVYRLWLRENQIPISASRRISCMEHARGYHRGVAVTLVDAPGWTSESLEALDVLRRMGAKLTRVWI